MGVGSGVVSTRHGSDIGTINEMCISTGRAHCKLQFGVLYCQIQPNTEFHQRLQYKLQRNTHAWHLPALWVKLKQKSDVNLRWPAFLFLCTITNDNIQHMVLRSDCQAPKQVRRRRDQQILIQGCLVAENLASFDSVLMRRYHADWLQTVGSTTHAQMRSFKTANTTKFHAPKLNGDTPGRS